MTTDNHLTDSPVPATARLVAQARKLTRRQATALATAIAAGAAAAVAALAGWTGTAVALVSTLMVVLAAGQVQLRRRQAQQEAHRRAGHRQLHQESVRLRREISALRGDVGTLADEVECGHRRLVAAVEKERAAAADRHTALQTLLNGSTRQLPQARPPE